MIEFLYGMGIILTMAAFFSTCLIGLLKFMLEYKNDFAWAMHDLGSQIRSFFKWRKLRGK